MTSTAARVAAWLAPRTGDALALLAGLVAIDSGTENLAGVEAVGRAVTARLAACGYAVERRPQRRLGPVFIARKRGVGSGRVLLIGHLDTVFPDGTAAARPLRIEGRRAYGPGVSDMKGGLVAIVFALEGLAAFGPEQFGEAVVLLTPDEEHPEQEAVPVIHELARSADACFVLEAGRENGDIVDERKGGYIHRLEVFGRAAHAGVEPEKGRDAILELAHKIIALRGLADPERELTVNVGLIEGGSASNVVPDHAAATFEFRAYRREVVADMERAIATLAANAVVEGTRTEIRRLGGSPPMERTPEGDRLVGAAVAIAAELGFALRAARTGGGSDGSFASEAGCPVLDGLGPIGGDDHSDKEWLDVESVVPRTALLAGLLAAAGTASRVVRG